MNHLFYRNRKRWAAARRLSKRFEGDAADIQSLRFPHFSCTFRRLKFASSKQPGAALLGGRTGDVSHSFQPDRAFGTKYLEAESRACCGECTEIAGHSFLHSKEY